MPVINCDNCGETFEKSKSRIERSENHYCSRECLHEKQKNRVELECHSCGVSFERPKSQAGKYEKSFCSNECQKNGRSGVCDNCGDEIYIRKSEEYLNHHFCGVECNSEFKSKRVDVECAYCGKEKSVTKSRRESYENHFCGGECLDKYRENGSKYDCQNCEKTVYRTPSQMEKSKADDVFCSQDCFHDWHRGENHTSYNQISVGCWWCGETISKKLSRVERNKRHFCNTKCFGKWTSWAGRGFDTNGNPTGEFGKDMPRSDWNPDIETKKQLKRMGVYDQYKDHFS